MRRSWLEATPTRWAARSKSRLGLQRAATALTETWVPRSSQSFECVAVAEYRPASSLRDSVTPNADRLRYP